MLADRQSEARGQFATAPRLGRRYRKRRRVGRSLRRDFHGETQQCRHIRGCRKIDMDGKFSGEAEAIEQHQLPQRPDDFHQSSVPALGAVFSQRGAPI